MSHFTMLVAGADYDYQLAPYHEYECTGHDDEFVKTFYVTKKYRERFKEAKAKYADAVARLKNGELTEEKFKEETAYSFKGKTFLQYLRDYERIPVLDKKPEKFGETEETKYSFAYRTKKGYTVIKRTNPNNYWDWYVEGGRYDGLLLLKKKDKDGNDVFVNQAKKKDIDFEEMWKRTIEKTTEKYNKVIEQMGKVPVVDTTWEEFCKKADDKEITWNEARAQYHEQPDVKLFNELRNNRENKYFSFYDSVEDFSCTLEEHIRRKSCHALTYGFVHKRKWYAKGEMGWWAISSNEKEPSSWDEQYKNFIETLPDNIMLTVIDCHI